MGDSFMDGAHVGLGHRIGDIIDEKLGDQVEVLNFGITSVGTVQELFIYRSKIRQFNPDLVILGFLTGNDIMNNSRTISLMTGFTPLKYAPYCEKKADGTFQYYPAPVPTERKIKDFLNRYSYSYRFFKPLIKNAIGKVLGYEKYNNPNEDSLLFSINLAFQSHLDSNSISKDLQQEFENNGISLSQNATIKKKDKKKDRKWVITDKHNKQVYHVWEEEGKLKVYQAVYEKHLLWSRPWPRKYLEYGVYGPPIDVEWQNAWDITEYTLLEIKKEVEADNTKFLLVILTDAIQIVPNPERAIQKYTGISPPDDFDVDYPTHRLVRFAKNNSIDCINLLPHFREYAKNHNLTEPYFSFKNDGHWSKLGHRVAANIVINWLKENISALP